MVELFGSRRRAEELARALEGGHAVVDARLQGLLHTASRLAAVPMVEPRPEFRDALREHLMEAAAAELRALGTDSPEQTDPTPQQVVTDDPAEARRRRRLVAVATGLVLVGGGTGVAAASEQALPGDVLYPVKRTIESAQVGLAQGASAEGRALLERAATRLDEAEVLGAESATTPTDLGSVSTALDDFAADAADGGDRLLQAYATSGDPSDLQTLRDFTRSSHETLEDLAEVLPPQARTSVIAADETVVQLDDRAFEACPDCTAATLPLTALTALSSQDVLLPELGDNASPYVPGSNPLTVPDLDERDPANPAEGKGGAGRPSAGSRQARTETAGPALPDVDLSEPDATQREGTSATGGGDTQTKPRLGLGDELDPDAPSGPSSPTDGLDLDPPLDGARNGGGGTLGGSTERPRKSTDRLQHGLDGLL